MSGAFHQYNDSPRAWGGPKWANGAASTYKSNANVQPTSAVLLLKDSTLNDLVAPQHWTPLPLFCCSEPKVFTTSPCPFRCTPTLPNLDVGLAILRRSPDGLLSLAGSVGSSVARDRNLELELAPGSYLVVPTTSGAVPAPAGAGGAGLVGGAAPGGLGGAVGWAGSAGLGEGGGLVGGSGDLTARARRALDLIAFTLDADMDGLLGEGRKKASAFKLPPSASDGTSLLYLLANSGAWMGCWEKVKTEKHKEKKSPRGRGRGDGTRGLPPSLTQWAAG